MDIKLKVLVRAIAGNFLPASIVKRPGSGGTNSPVYCYSVWLRHLFHLRKSGLVTNMSSIRNIAEIGPGDSLGTGIAAVFCGTDNYYAFDVIKHTQLQSNIQIAETVCDCFEKKLPVPSDTQFPNIHPEIDNDAFPATLLPHEPQYYKNRLKEITKAIKGEQSSVKIEYTVPWDSASLRKDNELDLIFSQAVMQHVTDIDAAYQAMYKWMKPGAVMSHQVDFKSIGISNEWNGHWYVPQWIWDFVARGRKIPVNRMPYTAHIKSLERAGFKIKYTVPIHKKNKFGNRKIKVKGYAFEEQDLSISGALIIAVK